MSSSDSLGIDCVNTCLNVLQIGRFLPSSLISQQAPRASAANHSHKRQSLKERPATKSPRAFCAHRRTRLLGHAMGLFSAGFPTGVNGAPNATSTNPTNRLPTSLLGQAAKATGRLHCYICNFLRVAQASLMCNSRIALFLAPFRDFLRISTTRLSCNSPPLWKGPRFCGKAAQTRANPARRDLPAAVP